MNVSEKGVYRRQDKKIIVIRWPITSTDDLRDLFRLKLLYGRVDDKGNTSFPILAFLLLHFGNTVEFCFYVSVLRL